MKITLCGSIAFLDEMQAVKEQLEKLGHEVKLPPSEGTNEKGEVISQKELYTIRRTAQAGDGWVWDRKEAAMRDHFDKVAWSNAILVLNYPKNNVPGYVGGNTLLEMGLAFHLGKKIFLLNPVPDISYQEEIFGMRPIVLNGDLGLIA